MHVVRDNEPDTDEVLLLLQQQPVQAALEPGPQSLAEALNRPPMAVATGSVPRNDTEAVEMIHEITVCLQSTFQFLSLTRSILY